MFKLRFSRCVVIADCPESGLPALDFRRDHGLPDGSDNKVEFKIDLVSEPLVRAIKSEWSDVIDGECDFRMPTAVPECHISTWPDKAWIHTPEYSTTEVTLPSTVIVSLLASDHAAVLTMILTFRNVYLAAKVTAEEKLAEWEAQQQVARREREKDAADLKQAEELLSGRLAGLMGEIKTLIEQRDTLATFLSYIPQDAKLGAARKMSENESADALQGIKDRIEAAHPETVFFEEAEGSSEDE